MHYLADYQTFATKQELNEAVANHLSRNRSALNETDRDVFLFIARYSVKYYGASHLKTTTIGDSLSKSRRTVQRSIKKMESLGMLEKKTFIRKKSGGFGANLYLILPYNDTTTCHNDDSTQTSDNTSVNEPKNDNEPISFNTNKTCSCDHDTSTVVIEPTLYERFKSLLTNTLGQAQEQASKLYGVYRAKSIRLMRFDYLKDNDELFADLGLQALHITTQATKKKNIRNLAGYYSGVLNNLIDKALFGEGYYKELEELAVY